MNLLPKQVFFCKRNLTLSASFATRELVCRKWRNAGCKVVKFKLAAPPCRNNIQIMNAIKSSCSIRPTAKKQSPIVSALLVALLSLGILASSPQLSSAAEEVLNNASIVELQGLNLGDSVILEKIRTSKCDFDTSINGLKQLKSAKISDAVIQAMIASKSPAAPATGSTMTAAKGDLNNPLAPHPAGVWLMQDKKMVQLEFQHARPETSGSYAWAGWGGQVEQFVSLSGAKADVQLPDRKPVFYFYFANGNQFANQGGAYEFMNSQNPKDIMLVKFDVRKNGANYMRALSISKNGAYGGSSTLGRAARDLEWEKIGEGIYKVIPKNELVNGEFAFSSTMSGGYGQLFPFGISSSSVTTNAADPEVQRLCEILKTGKPTEQIKALKDLRTMDAPEAVPSIVACLTSSNANVQRDACRTLAVLGTKAVIPSIEPLLKSSKADVKKDAQDAIDLLNSRQ